MDDMAQTRSLTAIIEKEGDGYVALYSDVPATWVTDGEFANRELVAPGTENVWICELGSVEDDGSFASFVAAISAASVTVNGTDVAYDSPSQGRVSFGWSAPLVTDGVTRDLGPHARYENPFTQMPWGARQLSIERGDASLHLDFDTGTRTGS